MEENGFRWPENQFPPARISSVFENSFPSMVVSASRKKLSSKLPVSIRGKNSFPIARMKDSFKKTFLDRKRSFLWKEFLNKCKKWLGLARKSVSITRNEAFVVK